MNTDDMNDAELDAFLKGEDALSGELQAMQQASPSAELDAVILARAQALMASENRPDAANDAADGQSSKHSPRMGLRWRVPAGIAATVLAGVLAHQAWQASSDVQRLPEVSEPAPAPQRTIEAETPAPPPAQQAQKPAAPARMKQAAPRRAAPAPQEAPVEASMAEIAPPPPPPPPSLSYSPAPMAAAPAAEASRMVTVTGRSNRSSIARAAAPDPKAWLAAIDELLKAGLQRDTLEEWDKFRAAYPDYPVPAETTDKISALRK